VYIYIYISEYMHVSKIESERMARNLFEDVLEGGERRDQVPHQVRLHHLYPTHILKRVTYLYEHCTTQCVYTSYIYDSVHIRIVNIRAASVGIRFRIRFVLTTCIRSIHSKG
jgi:hypothetical protein